MEKYQETEKVWNESFKKQLDSEKRYDASKQIPSLELEEGMKWLVKNSNSIIDFGCGSGNLISKSVYLGINEAIGIDISSNAIEIAKQTSKINDISSKTNFKIGGLQRLSELENNSIDSGALFNILDNLLPKDSIYLLKEMNRIIKKNGKLLVKLNSVFPKKVFDENNYYTKISEDFYKENSGLYYWNLSETKFLEIIKPFFKLEKYIKIPIKNTTDFTRLYCLISIK